MISFFTKIKYIVNSMADDVLEYIQIHIIHMYKYHSYKYRSRKCANWKNILP